MINITANSGNSSLHKQHRRFNLNDPNVIQIKDRKLISIKDNISLMKQMIETMSIHEDSFSVQAIEKRHQMFIKKAQRPIDATIRLEGKLIGGLVPDIHLWGEAAKLHKSGMSKEVLFNKLKQEYGDKVEIVEYSPGRGPSYVDFINEVKGKDYLAELAASMDESKRFARFQQKMLDDLRADLLKAQQKKQSSQTNTA